MHVTWHLYYSTRIVWIQTIDVVQYGAGGHRAGKLLEPHLTTTHRSYDFYIHTHLASAIHQSHTHIHSSWVNAVLLQLTRTYTYMPSLNQDNHFDIISCTILQLADSRYKNNDIIQSPQIHLHSASLSPHLQLHFRFLYITKK